MPDSGPSMGLITVLSTLTIMICGGGVILTVLSTHPSALHLPGGEVADGAGVQVLLWVTIPLMLGLVLGYKTRTHERFLPRCVPHSNLGPC